MFAYCKNLVSMIPSFLDNSIKIYGARSIDMNIMNVATKIFLATLFITNMSICSHEDQRRCQERIKKEQQLAGEKAAFWTGVTLASIAAGSALAGYIIGSSESTELPSYVCEQNNSQAQSYQSSAKINDIERNFVHLSKYGQSFNFTQRGNDIEKALESNIAQLNTNLYCIDDSFIKMLDEDLTFLNNAGYTLWWESGLNELKSQKDCYLSNAKQLKNYFKAHDDFFHGYKIINFYDNFPSSPSQFPSYIRSYYQGSEQYPLIALKNNAQKNRIFLEKIGRSSFHLYPLMLKKAQTTIHIIDHVISLLCMSNDFQEELDRQKRDIIQENLLTTQRQIAQTEKDRINLIRREVEARETSNNLKLREIRALEERNRIDRERNRIEAAAAGIYFRD